MIDHGLDARVTGWEERLIAAVQAHISGPFEWGTRDCATLFATCVEAVTGASPAADIAPWFSAQSALRNLRHAGFASVQDLVLARFTIIYPSHAQRGDIGYPAGPIEPLSCPAVITGAEAVSMTADGFIMFPASKLAITYRVG